ncbi:MAG: NAD kinase [Bacteroidales bacterium]|nr:NAD kinase [Bacteroidales bacterium]
MMKIAVYGNSFQDASVQYVDQLLRLLCEHPGVEVAIDPDYLAYLSERLAHEPLISHIIGRYGYEADLALSIGGDGTFLSTVRKIGPSETPIMGLNSGRLGYLSAARISQVHQVAHLILSRQYAVEPRSMLQATVTSRWEYAPQMALNDVAILKQDTASMITVNVYVGGELLAKYLGDGLIVSTPTGSTGYNLSVGGPIVAPSSPSWVLSPVAAHSLNMRPLVVSDATQMDIEVVSRTHTALISVDGQSMTLPDDARLHLERAPYVTNVVHVPGHSFIHTLREKLMWGVDSR